MASAADSQRPLFQSTRPVRGATAAHELLRGGVAVSIHAPRAGRDGGIVTFVTQLPMFQSTRPVRGAT